MGLDGTPRCSIPDADGLVVAAGGQVLSIRAVSHREDVTRVPLQGLHGHPCCSLPDADGVVKAAGGQVLSIRAVSHRVDTIRVTRSVAHVLARFCALRSNKRVVRA